MNVFCLVSNKYNNKLKMLPERYDQVNQLVKNWNFGDVTVLQKKSKTLLQQEN